MYTKTTLVAAAALAGSAMAQRPSNMSICDYYTTALLKNNTAANQATVLTLIVNTAVIGNYTKPQIAGVTFPDIAVPGILANGTVNGTMVNLAPYFNGGLASTNRGGDEGVSVNFLDDGGAVPLMMNKPANGTSSNQYFLLTHLYEYFGTLLGCSQQGMTGFSKYDGSNSQYSVHKYMDLSDAEFTYFIEQVGLSAASFGVTPADVTAVATSLQKAFGLKCAAPTTIIPSQDPAAQAICIGDGCPTAMNATCPAAMPSQPGVANASLAMGEGNKSSSATSTAANGGSMTAAGNSASMTGASASASATGAAAAVPLAGSAVVAGLGFLAFLL